MRDQVAPMPQIKQTHDLRAFFIELVICWAFKQTIFRIDPFLFFILTCYG